MYRHDVIDALRGHHGGTKFKMILHTNFLRKKESLIKLSKIIKIDIRTRQVYNGQKVQQYFEVKNA